MHKTQRQEGSYRDVNSELKIVLGIQARCVSHHDAVLNNKSNAALVLCLGCSACALGDLEPELRDAGRGVDQRRARASRERVPERRVVCARVCGAHLAGRMRELRSAGGAGNALAVGPAQSHFAVEILGHCPELSTWSARLQGSAAWRAEGDAPELLRAARECRHRNIGGRYWMA